MIGNLLIWKISPSEIENMNYTRLKYYNDMYEALKPEETPEQ